MSVDAKAVVNSTKLPQHTWAEEGWPAVYELAGEALRGGEGLESSLLGRPVVHR